MRERIQIHRNPINAKKNRKSFLPSPLFKTGTSSENKISADIRQRSPACACGGGCQRCESAPALQAKLKVGAPDDKYEPEADRVADQVMLMPQPSVQRQEDDELDLDEEDEIVRTKLTGGSVPQPSPNVTGQIEALRGKGQALPQSARDYFEPRFGQDFGGVYIHTDRQAAEAASSIKARAFTRGKDVVFGAGEYALGTNAGQRLLAHELAHVIQQTDGSTACIQRTPAPTKTKRTGSLQLPWAYRGYQMFEVKNSGIRLLIGIKRGMVQTIRTRIPAIANRIAADNKLIRDPAFRVRTCFIASTTTRFALYQGKPVLMLNPADADSETTAHEMGHAIFYYLNSRAASKAPDSGRAKNFRLRVADIYARLAKTKQHKEGSETHAAGLWMVDPSQWMPGSPKEHPWDDPDEFFASAKEAYQINRPGLMRAIKRFKIIDPKVGAPAGELLKLLSAFLGKGRLPTKGIAKSRITVAEKALKRGTGVSKVEVTLSGNVVLQWILKPSTRPKAIKAKPGAVFKPAPVKRPKKENLVTGKGGVIDQMKKRFRERLRGKIRDSVYDL